MRRIVPTVARYSFPDAPFRALINANRQDQTVKRYATYEDLAAYCELSANPVGHLVLYVFEAATPERFWLSDMICTGLQLTEHWQDVAEDFQMDRVYLPQEDLDRFDCSLDVIAQRRPTRDFRTLMQFEVDRAWDLFDRGATLVRTLPGVRGMAIAAFIEGGRAALGAIREADYDVLTQSPRPNAPSQGPSGAASSCDWPWTGSGWTRPRPTPTASTSPARRPAISIGASACCRGRNGERFARSTRWPARSTTSVTATCLLRLRRERWARRETGWRISGLTRRHRCSPPLGTRPDNYPFRCRPFGELIDGVEMDVRGTDLRDLR